MGDRVQQEIEAEVRTNGHVSQEGISKQVSRLIWATALLYVVGLAIVLGVLWVRSNDIENQAQENTQARYALCAFRADLRNRVKDGARQLKISESFLADNPNGIPGVPVETLRASVVNRRITLDNQRKTLQSFAGYLTDCPQEEGR